jgi:U3 small nucleolar RNA-associated protein 11
VLDKNPDEFYFGMVSKSGPSAGKNSTGTLNGDKGNKVLSQEAVRLFKTQDLGYVRTVRNKTSKEVEALRRRCAGIEGEGSRVVFVDGEEEMEERVGADEDRMEVEEEIQKRLRKAREKENGKLRGMLEAAEKRLEALTEAEEALDLQRKKMAKTMSVGGINKDGVKFKVRERKR